MIFTMALGRMLRRAFVLATLTLAGLAAALPQQGAPAAESSAPLVAVVDIKGPIGPATSDYFTRALEKAREMRAAAVVLRMDTPGGLSSAMRDIIRDIITSPMPVLTFVAPGGSRAASAGTYILYASHVAAMAPGTNLGAATPVPLTSPLPGMPGPKKDDKPDKDGKNGKESKDGKNENPAAEGAPNRKAINDARAYIRALAQMRGRNVEWAERAVTEAASLSAEEALKAKVIDLIAENIPDLLAKAEGRKVKVAAGEVTIAAKGAALRDIPPDWRAKLLAVITNPNIAYILLLAGFYGIVFEFYNPGIIFSGVIGAICLVLALFALHVLPVNYAGLALIVLGIAFMAAEAMVPSFGALGLGGVAALVIGSIILIDTDAPGFGISWAVIGSVAGVSALLSFTVLAMAARAWRRPVVSGREAMIGAWGRVVEWGGGEGRVRVKGEVWHAKADNALSPGDDVRVTSIDGLTLQVAPADRDKETENDHGN